ncbi:MAG TPA: bifunctional diaminohydroxyphosphoribosylaminopyrimidine deaminase/5-amino-6-(5-phosphoribosylamino)uracil reductase RibD [Clostridiales bacterium]|nr:bifunctional diaminohydroxyphosphoribosylaminopyrimidine deaminase/5-amino-6-(5-phosphoribosylamino)uracil reductase RibD [Clostridiales bacterium]
MLTLQAEQDEKWMRKALQLAERAWGRTSPNPLVGCVIVKDGDVLAEGYHSAPGLDHAERAAINQARQNGVPLTGATLYVNLEPCSHHGRTPPCADLIIESGIGTVVAAISDPNPRVAGQGFRKLQNAGIRLRTGVLAAEAQKLNEIFIKYITTGLPFILMKSAISLDGKIATRTGNSKWISGEVSRQVVHHWRDRVAGIMVGKNTVLLDNPSLTTRQDDQPCKNPIRIIVASTGALPSDSRVFQACPPGGVILATTSRMPASSRTALERMGTTVICLDGEDGKVDLWGLVRLLGLRGLDSIMLEGGLQLNEAFLQAGLIDKIMLFMAPKIIGGCDAVSCFNGLGCDRLTDAVGLDRMTITPCGDDWLIEGYPQNTKGC